MKNMASWIIGMVKGAEKENPSPLKREQMYAEEPKKEEPKKEEPKAEENKSEGDAPKKDEQLKMGEAVEKEHKPTVDKIKSSCKDGKITMSDEDIFSSIAQDHIKEIPDYYTRLAKMEKEGRRIKSVTLFPADAKQVESILNMVKENGIKGNIHSGKIVGSLISFDGNFIDVKTPSGEKTIEASDVNSIELFVKMGAGKPWKSLIPEVEKEMETFRFEEVSADDPLVKAYEDAKKEQDELILKRMKESESWKENIPAVEESEEAKKLKLEKLPTTSPEVERFKKERTPGKKPPVITSATKEDKTVMYTRLVQEKGIDHLVELFEVAVKGFGRSLDYLGTAIAQVRENIRKMERKTEDIRGIHEEQAVGMVKSIATVKSRMLPKVDTLHVFVGEEGKEFLAVSVDKVRGYGEKADPNDPDNPLLKKIFSAMDLVEMMREKAQKNIKNADEWVANMDKIVEPFEGIEEKVRSLKVPLREAGSLRIAAGWLSELYESMKDWFVKTMLGMDETEKDLENVFDELGKL
jgi:hypothetical protein